MITFSNVVIGYPGRVICGINAVFPDNGIVSVIGKNGVGKTTLFKSMCKEVPLRDGEIKYDGKSLADLSLPDLAKIQCFVPQNIDTRLNIPVSSWILMGLAPYFSVFNHPSKEDMDKVYAVAEKLGITSLLDQPIYYLSGGEIRRVEIARALIQGSKVWLLDEIYSQLDPDVSVDIRALLKEEAKDKLIIVSTHCIQTAIRTSDMVLAFWEGKKIADLLPTDRLDTPVLLESVYRKLVFRPMEKVAWTIEDGNWITH